MTKSLTTTELRHHIELIKRCDDEIKQLEKQKEEHAQVVIKELGVKGVFAFGEIKCVVMQARTRRVEWKKLAYKLAHIVYSDAGEFRKWLRSIVKRYPKKPCAAYVRLFEVKQG